MSRWLEQPERGSTLLVRVIAGLTLRIGRPVGRALLYPICLYFALFSGRARSASRDYLTRALGQPAGLLDLLRHYHTFAAVILDRLFFVTGKFDGYQITIEGRPALDAVAGRGCLLLSAHFGSFDVLRSLALMQARLPIKILMYTANAQRVLGVLNQLNPALADSVIELGSPGAMLAVKEVVEQGGMVGLLADRTRGDERTATIDFLGRAARFPVGPLMLAAVLKVPVLTVYGIYEGDRRYRVRIEALADQVPLDRRTAPAEVAEWVGRYAASLERCCRAAPYNWFNFYPFWPADNA